MHIVFACDEYPPEPSGGIGLFVQKLAQGLVLQGAKATVVGMYPIAEPERRETINGVHVWRIRRNPTRVVGPLAARLVLYRKIEEITYAQRVSVIEYPDFQSMLWRSHSVPTIVRLHGNSSFLAEHGGAKRPSFGVRIAEERALRVADLLVAVSRYVASEAIEKAPHKEIRVIRNFVDTRVFRNRRLDRSNTVLFVGTLAAHKGVFALAQAANIFLKRLPDWHLVFVGRDTIHDGKRVSLALTSLVSDALLPRLRILPAIPHVELGNVLSTAGVCVFPSKVEAFGLAVAEAMAAGAPVVASDRGALKELVEDGLTGVLINPDDDQALAGAIVALCEDPSVRKRMGEHASEQIHRELGYQKGIEENAALYSALSPAL